MSPLTPDAFLRTMYDKGWTPEQAAETLAFMFGLPDATTMAEQVRDRAVAGSDEDDGHTMGHTE